VPDRSTRKPALFGIIVALCRRAGIGQVPSLYFLPSGVPTAFATGVGDQSVIVVSSGLLRLLMTRELTGVLAHEITHIAKHDVELMQLAGIVGQMTRLIAQVAIIIAIATWLLDIFRPGEGVDGLSLGVLVAAPIVANLILGALSRQREYQADLEAVALTGDPAGLARAIELIEMARKRITSHAFPGAVRIRPPRLLSSHPDPKDRIRRLRQSVAEEGPPGPDERIAIPDYFPDERKRLIGGMVESNGLEALDLVAER
jgi:heat shock protein HtpX